MFTPHNTVLVVVDVQGKLAKLVYEHKRLFQNIQGMIQVARILSIPILWTEQAPHKIGKTVADIAKPLKALKVEPIEKLTFSACGCPPFIQALKNSSRRQVLLAGIETHVCVYQTAVDLIKLGYQVQVVADCVSSRTLANKELGLERIKATGAQLTCLEMIACELLRTSEHSTFKNIVNISK